MSWEDDLPDAVPAGLNAHLPLLRKLEGSGDAATSSAGASGRYQIMPDTARRYGFDPSRLSDPAYSARVASAVMDDNLKRTGGRLDDALVLYNASPKVYHRWLAAGRDPAALPAETRKYLAHAEQITGAPLVAPAWEQALPSAAPPATPAKQEAWEAQLPDANHPQRSPLEKLQEFGQDVLASGAQDIAGIARGAAGKIETIANAATNAGMTPIGPYGASGTPLEPDVAAQGQAEVKAAPRAVQDQVAQAVSPLQTWGQQHEVQNPDWAGKAGDFTGGMLPALAGGALGPGGMIETFSDQGYDETQQDALHHGATPEQAQTAAVAGAQVGALAGAVPVGEIAGLGAEKLGLKGVAGWLGQRATSAASMGGLMGGQQIANNAVAQQSYDPDRPWYQQVPEAMASGALGDLAFGGVIHPVTGAVAEGGRRALGKGWDWAAGALRPADKPAKPGAPAVDPSMMPAADALQRYAGIEPQAPATPGEPAPQLDPVTVGRAKAADMQPGDPVLVDTPQGLVKADVEAVHAPDDAPPTVTVKTPAGVADAPIAKVTALPKAFEAEREAYGAPLEQMPQAIADTSAWKNSPKAYNLFRAIRDLGGLRTVDADGNPNDAAGILQGAKGLQPGVKNNKTGLTPDAMREALQQRGWFGAFDQTQDGADTSGAAKPGDTPDEFFEKLRDQAQGRGVFHPDTQTADSLAHREELDAQMLQAGVSLHDTPQEAAAKLAAWRAEQTRMTSAEGEALLRRAQDLGIKARAGVTYDELHMDVLEREAIAAQDATHLDQLPTGSELDHFQDAIERELSPEQYYEFALLTPDDHEWLSHPDRGARGGEAQADRPEDYGFPPEPEAASAAQAAASGAVASGAGEDQGGARPAEPVAPPTTTEHQTLGSGERVEQNLLPGAERSAQQAAAAREGALKPKAPQRTDIGGLFDLDARHEQGLFDQAEHGAQAGLEAVAKTPEQQAIADIFADAERQAFGDGPATEGRPAYGEANTYVKKDIYEAAKARMLARQRNQLNAGIDPEAMHDGFLMTAYHIEAGARTFHDFSKAMLADLGEWARPYLKSWYESVRHAPGFDASGMTPEAEITPDLVARVGHYGDQPAEIAVPTERVEAQATHQGQIAERNHDLFQPAAMPVTAAAAPAGDGADALRKTLKRNEMATGPNGEAVTLHYKQGLGYSVSVSKDGIKETFGGAGGNLWSRNMAIDKAVRELHPEHLEIGDSVTPKPEAGGKSAVPPETPRRVVGVSGDGQQITLDGGLQLTPSELQPARKEPEHGISGPLFERPAGERPEAVHGAEAQRAARPAPEGQDRGGVPVSGADAGAGAEGAERAPIGPAGIPAGGGAGNGADAGVPDAGKPTDAGTARRPAPDANVKGENFRIEPGAVAEERGAKTKARDNLEAIRLAKQLIADKRAATREEQAVLAKYVGWGGLAGAFDPKNASLRDVGDQLRSLLTPEEHKTALRSTQYAHYTAEHVIRGMWKAVRDMGFEGGSVLEPGMGVGHFLGMAPADLAERIHYQGIEMDGLTADIARLLYPQSGVRQGDFTRTPIPENTFDLAIGNPPFSDTVIKADPKYAARGFMLHDYFFAKSLDSVRPGGLLGFVTSAGTMNKMSREARHYLAKRATFLGGARLPSDTFRKNAGTDVTTDVLFFQKRDAPISLDEAAKEPWTETVIRTLPGPDGEETRGHVNRYFSDHPEQVLGEEGFFDKLYKGRYGVHAIEGVDPATALHDALDRLPKDVMQPAPTPAEKAFVDFAAPEHKDGSFYLHEGKLMQYSDGAGRPVAGRGKGVEGGISAADQQRISHLVPIRDALREVFHHDLAENSEAGAVARANLNAHYDAFVKKFGPINKAEFQYRRPNVLQQEAARAEAREQARDRGEAWNEGSYSPDSLPPKSTLADHARARQDLRDQLGAAFDEGDFNPADIPDIVIEKRPNIAAFMDDPESYRLRAIENYNEASGEASKKDIFHRSVITREVEPQLNSANDGVLWSLNKFGRFDPEAIAEKMGRSPEEIVQELGERVYRLPGTERSYQTADEYLSGDIYDKLAEAKAMAASDPEMRRNVAALEAAIPPPLSPSEISMILGMPWIPHEHVVDFARDHLRIGEITARHNGALGGWVIGSPRSRGTGDAEWSTSTTDAEHILAFAMNRLPVRIYKSVFIDGEKRSEFDPIATQAVVDKIDAMKQAFQDFISNDPPRESALADTYNTSLNRTVLRKYDGSYLTTPGVSSDWSWRPHQQRVVSRIVQSGNTYMAHAVGAGKTSAMIGAGMEMRRLGLVKKPMYVVPNHMLGQFTKEFYEQYPTARISVADERRFHTSRRKQFIANVAQDDLDAVIITHSAFGKIPVSAEFQKTLIGREVDKVKRAMDGLDKSSDRLTIKKLENLKEKLEQRLSGAMGSRKDATNTFEELGVDHVMVDEAHLFRKLSFATRQSMKGIDPNGSEMAWDLYSKIQYLEGKNPGRSAVLASGTPVTNTMGELYTLSRFMQPQELERLGLDHFDSWAASFGDTKTALEQSADGSYEPVTRFAKFVNMPELYKMVGQAMDIVTPAQLEQYVVRPQLEGGARMFHLAPSTEFMKEVQASLGARMAAIKARKGPPQKGDDILLSVINDGRHSSIDPRFVAPHADPHAPSKLNEMIDNVHRIWSETRNQQFYDPKTGYKTEHSRGPATQMIFSNLGINASENRPFSGYAWMKSELLRRGVPASEIAVIGDYKSTLARQKLFNDMNEGKVRILIGSSQKMGTGVNAQRRLFALHNLDPLWFPADDEQRCGRILRQGNLNKTIQIHDYSTKGTYDATMWQMMGNKARFIEQFFRGDPELREMEDLGEASHFEQAAAMATTDERLITLTDYRQQLEKAERRKQTHEREQYSMGQRRRLEAGTIEDAQHSIAEVQADIALRKDTRGEAFNGNVGGKPVTDRAKAAEAMEKEYKAVFPGLTITESHKLGDIGGFNVLVRKEFGDVPSFHLQRNYDTQKLGDKSSSMKGIIASAESRLGRFEQEISYHQERQEAARRAIASLDSQIGKPFTGGEEITSLRAKVKGLEAEIAASNAGAKAAAPELAKEAPELGQDAPEDASFARGQASESAAEPAAPRARVPTAEGEAPGPRLPKNVRFEPLHPVDAKADALIDAVDKELQRLVPFAEGHAASALHEIGPDGEAAPVSGAAYRDGLRHVVLWALDSADARGVPRHEAVHMLRKAGLFRPEEWDALAQAAQSEGWLDTHRIAQLYPDLTPEAQVEEAVAEHFREWRRPTNPESFRDQAFAKLGDLFDRVRDASRRILGKGPDARDVLSRIQSGEIGARQGGQASADGRAQFARRAAAPADEPDAMPPGSFVNRLLGQHVDAAARKLKATAERWMPDPVAEAIDDAKMLTTPMGLGGVKAQAEAKDFANAVRATVYEHGKIDDWISKRFSLAEQKLMWEAADEHGVLLRRGVEPGPGQGKNRLTPEMREVVDTLQRNSDRAYQMAVDLGMATGEGLESYVPRMVAQMTAFGMKTLSRVTKRQAAKGANLTTTTGQLRQRKYETVEETEAAAQEHFGEQSMVVRNIRTLNLATQRLEQAIAGRILVDKIKTAARVSGSDPVVEGGANPDPSRYFTLDHPALRKGKPRKIIEDPETGKMRPLENENGDPIIDYEQTWIPKDYEGPLNAVLSSRTGGLVNGLLQLKAKMVGVVMYNPMIHNAVIWGKAIPADPKGVLTFQAYRTGYAAKTDPATMREAITAGLDPIGHRFFNQDLASLSTEPAIAPGRSWTAQLIGKVGDLFGPDRGAAVRDAVDKIGDVWHNTFLWDRVADLQMGLYVKTRDHLLRQSNQTGLSAQDAQRIAAHFANRYAGALPMESMSKVARNMANLVLFSRSFTLGNLAAYKDVLAGLPSDVRSQIQRDGGLGSLNTAQGLARRKAGGMLILDMGLSAVGLSLASLMTAWLTGQKWQLPTDNEPGRKNRFLLGYQKDGTAIYGRLPTGKVGEELYDWMTDPHDILMRKLSPYGRFAYLLATNDQGFGRKLNDPTEHVPVVGPLKHVLNAAWQAFGPGAMLPIAQLKAAAELTAGSKDPGPAALRALLPLAGVTISKGAPGGPAMGDLYAAKDHHEYVVSQALPDIQQQIKDGDVQGARAKMRDLGIPVGLQNYYVRVAKNPALRLSPRAVRDFAGYATPEQKAQLARDRAAGAERAQAQSEEQ